MNEVKQPKKPLIYYYCIAILVLMLFNFLAMPWLMQRQIIQVDYGTFMTMIEERDIGQLEIQEQENQIIFTNAEIIDQRFLWLFYFIHMLPPVC